MANLVVTSTTNNIVVVFNDLAGSAFMEKGTWPKTSITSIILAKDNGHVEVHTNNTFVKWLVSYDGSTTGTFQVDSVNGSAPTSNSDLYDKLVALLP